jgi:radical SAM superfamily enzyme YgiQ (UPF0313 family)
VEKKFKIYLADFAHDYLPGNYVVPLNVGLLKAYLVSKFPKNVEIILFKSPQKFLDALSNFKEPDIVGFSNYSWNQELNRNIIHKTIELFPNTVVCVGGPHIRTDPQGIKDYLIRYNEIDYYCMFEGEIPLGNIVEYFIQQGKSLKKNSCSKPLDGVAYVCNDKLFYPPITNNEKIISNIPSPYLTGVLDEFLESKQWVPLLETNRGCPYGCTFCVWGISALDNVRVFPIDRSFDEIEYVAKRSPSPRWIFADANFGMLKRDLEMAKRIRAMADKYNKLEMAQIWWAKNSSKNTLEISRTFGHLVEPMAAVQSMDMGVLEIIKRDNIKFSTMTDLLDEWNKDNLSTSTDVLVGLPGESLQSHLNTLRKVFELGFDRIEVGNIRLLPGSEMETDECRNKYELKTKYRLISGGYGKYGDMPIFEYEESVRSSKDIEENEMLSLRLIHFLIWALWNLGIGKPILKYLQLEYKQNPLDVILDLIESTKNEQFREFVKKFNQQSIDEWFDTPEELTKYYEKNFEKLIEEGFLKLNFRYLAEIFFNKNFAQTIIHSLVERFDDLTVQKLARFCFERIYFPNSSQLVKDIHVDSDVLIILKKIYPELIFDSNICRFIQTEQARNAIKYELEKYGFENDPIRSLALTLETYKSKFLYDFQFSNKNKETVGEFTSSFDYHAQLGPLKSNK